MEKDTSLSGKYYHFFFDFQAKTNDAQASPSLVTSLSKILALIECELYTAMYRNT